MKRINLLVIFVLLASMLAACNGDPKEKVVEKEVTRVVQETVMETITETIIVEGTPQTVEQQVTRVVEVEKVVTATPEPEQGPAVGGALVWRLAYSPDTLDCHLITVASAARVSAMIGASLVAKDPQTDEFVPYLAESWEALEDSTVWEFKLREDITFHDGTPLTAHDYAWTFLRALEISPAAGAALMGVAGVEAVDDYTLRFTMALPNYPMLNSLTDTNYFQPLSQAYVEAMGDDYGRNPMGVGPYKFKEWATDEKVVLERNPDYAWGPAWAHEGAPYIETIEFRIIPEDATALAGLETGEIDWINLDVKDLERIQETGEHNVLESLIQGLEPYVQFNVSAAPFDDVRVRQAFNLAVDREVLVRVAALGHAVPQFGPISASVNGYWPGVEYVGYGYDLEKAKALMAEAGWEDTDGDGVLDKDGQPFKFALKTPAIESFVKAAVILQEQYKALGVDLEVEQLESGVFSEQTMTGEYEIAVNGIGWQDSLLLFAMYHSMMIGGFNASFVEDPELDALLDGLMFAPDGETHLQASADAQRYIIEQALVVPLYTSMTFSALGNRVQGWAFSSEGSLYLDDAYIETGPAE